MKWPCHCAEALLSCSGLVIMQWRCFPAMALSLCKGLVIMQWPCHCAKALSSCSGLVIVQRPCHHAGALLLCKCTTPLTPTKIKTTNNRVVHLCWETVHTYRCSATNPARPSTFGRGQPSCDQRWSRIRRGGAVLWRRGRESWRERPCFDKLHFVTALARAIPEVRQPAECT